MGNNSSKHSGSKSSGAGPLQRTDTSGSAKSSRSIRLKLSISSMNNGGSGRLSMDRGSGGGGGSGSDDRSISSRHRNKSGIDPLHSSAETNEAITDDDNVEDERRKDRAPPAKSVSRKGSSSEMNAEVPSFSRNNSSSNLLSTSFSDNSKLPPSMKQIQPKEPILMRRNTNDTINTSLSVSGFETAAMNSPLATSPLNTNSISRTSTHSVPSLLNHLSSSSSLSTTDLPNLLPGNDMSRGPNNPGDGGAVPKSPSLNPNQYDDTKSIQSSRQSLAADLTELAKTSSSAQNHLSKQATTSSSMGGGSNTIEVEDLIQRLLDAGYSGKRTKNVCLKNAEIQLICATAREIFLSQPSLLELSPPVKVVGDVHGQYGDLIRIFTKCGFPPQTNYLFLGDYVDRGKQSLETILLLLCYKIKYPENFFLLRGNHECANVTRVYGFYDECKRRCNIKTWKLFVDTFNTLPIAAIVAGKIFCVHGGLSPVLNSMDEIRNIARPTDVPDFGLLNDLLWSDPADTINEWEDNERGVSYVFSKVAINKFLSKFGFDLVCRAHMVVEDGYEFFNDRTLVTVFSAPNYCGEFDNWGAVMSVSEELLCSFELLDPLDSVALKQVMKKGKQERKTAQSLQRIQSR